MLIRCVLTVERKSLMRVSAGVMGQGHRMDIELRLLRSLVAIHEAGSISRAADQMACTQGAMSMRLKLLETEIGAPLFLRRPGGLQPTPRGAELYARALGVLSAYDEMMSLTRSRPPRDKLRLGMPDDYASGWLGGLIADLGPSFDRLEIELSCDLSANLLAALERREIDLAMVTTAARPARTLQTVDLPLRWLTAPGWSAAEVTLAAYPDGCVFRRTMTRTLDSVGQPWRVGVQSRGQAGIFAAVRSGRAVTTVAAGTGPADLIEHETLGTLPRLPLVPLHLVLGEDAPLWAKRAAEALSARLCAVVAAQ